MNVEAVKQERAALVNSEEEQQKLDAHIEYFKTRLAMVEQATEGVTRNFSPLERLLIEELSLAHLRIDRLRNEMEVRFAKHDTGRSS